MKWNRMKWKLIGLIGMLSITLSTQADAGSQTAMYIQDFGYEGNHERVYVKVTQASVDATKEECSRFYFNKTDGVDLDRILAIVAAAQISGQRIRIDYTGTGVDIGDYDNDDDILLCNNSLNVYLLGGN